MKCKRCDGAMAREKFYGPGEPFWGWRCIQCGEIFDLTILTNRAKTITLAEARSSGTSAMKKERRAATWLSRRALKYSSIGQAG